MTRYLFVLALVGIVAVGTSSAVLAGDTACNGQKAEKSACAKVVKASADEKGACVQSCGSKASCSAGVAKAASNQKGCCAEKGAKATVAANTQKGGCSDKASCASQCAKPAVASNAGCSSEGKRHCSSKYLPAMAYRIGDKTTHCSKEAKTLAASHGASIHYVVGDKSFTDQVKAMNALADASDKFVVRFASVESKAGCTETKVCPTTGKKFEVKSDKAGAWTVAARTYDCSTKAKKASEIARKAMASVAMKYRVGGKDFCCSTMAGAEAKKASAPIQYVVGDDCTGCEVTARLTLARAKVDAADRAINEAGLSGTGASL